MYNEKEIKKILERAGELQKKSDGTITGHYHP